MSGEDKMDQQKKPLPLHIKLGLPIGISISLILYDENFKKLPEVQNNFWYMLVVICMCLWGSMAVTSGFLWIVFYLWRKAKRCSETSRDAL
jgi:hypothetical protein